MSWHHYMILYDFFFFKQKSHVYIFSLMTCALLPTDVKARGQCEIKNIRSIFSTVCVHITDNRVNKKQIGSKYRLLLANTH